MFFHDLFSVDVGRHRRCWQPNPNPQRLAPTFRRGLVTSERSQGGSRCGGEWQMFFPLILTRRTGDISATKGGTFGTGFIFSLYCWKCTMTYFRWGLCNSSEASASKRSKKKMSASSEGLRIWKAEHGLSRRVNGLLKLKPPVLDTVNTRSPAWQEERKLNRGLGGSGEHTWSQHNDVKETKSRSPSALIPWL